MISELRLTPLFFFLGRGIIPQNKVREGNHGYLDQLDERLDFLSIISEEDVL